ncbi:MAG TPA: hypothetical protein VK968_01115, partial [Roseimicrobium sp.]|nr:hypothetical protein [Roseimicrobium sp.]
SAKAIEGGKISFWPDRPDQAQVVTGSFLGGAGNEWLVGGDFLPDKTLVLAGNVAGPVFDLGVTPVILGTDGARPAEFERAKDKKGEVVPPSWVSAGVTGFLVRLSPDYTKVVSVSRLPWESASITSIVADDKGAIYIAGKATERIAATGKVRTLPVREDVTRKKGQCDFTFIAKLSPDASTIVWLQTAKGLSDAPSVKLRNDGNITFASQDVKTITPDGKLVAAAVVAGGVRETTSVSPIDGRIAVGGEHHWGTGREPWRCPTLNIYQPDGKQVYQLYDWGGPYVGLDTIRAVSDSAVRLVQHDNEGNILLFAWSDGGNSVMTRMPQDARRGVGLNGLGLTSAGANVSSFGYLIKIEPKDFQVIGYTFWCARFNGKPNGIDVNALSQTEDGSLAIGGGSAWGLTQTSNFIGRSEPAGNYVAVLTPDLTGMRFCSAIPGVGTAVVGNDAKDIWGIGSGTVDRKPLVVFTTGAAESGETYGHAAPTPTVNASQGKFGGGWSDGWFLVLDLSKSSAESAKPVVPNSKPRRLTVEASAERVDPKKPPKGADEGAVFNFSPKNPKYVSVEAEFRDVKGQYWPSFAYGKPQSGSIRIRNGQPEGALVVSCESWTQPNGSQSRRVLGQHVESVKGGPLLTMTVKSIAPGKTEKFQTTDDKGKKYETAATTHEAMATLQIGAESIDIKPKILFSYNAKGRDDAVVGIRGTALMTLKGSVLGLKGPLAQEEVDVRIAFQGLTGE